MTKKTIGRHFNFDINNDEQILKKTFTLKSGQIAEFELEHISANKVADLNVDIVINGRDQDALTSESVANITSTLKLHQFYPAIAMRKNNVISLLDGSRRRFAALELNLGLDVLITDSDISTADAKQLAKDIQTAKEHNLRDVGKRLAVIQKMNNYSNQELAESEDISVATVTRALQAAQVDDKLINLFGSQQLSTRDYGQLYTYQKNNKPFVEDESAWHQLENQLENQNEPEKQAIFSALNLVAKQLSNKNNTKKAPKFVSILHQSDDKNRFARIIEEGEKLTFESKRLTQDEKKQITVFFEQFFGVE